MRNEVGWECMESSECQCNLQQAHFTPDHFSKHEHLRSLTGSEQVESEEESLDEHTSEDEPMLLVVTGPPLPKPKYHRLSTRWRDIVREYSGLRLTYHKDKLPAVSGLARQMQPYRHDRYIAGMWYEDIPSSILWSLSYGAIPQPRPSNAVGPSWSWVSVQSQVHISGNQAYDAQITDIDIILSGPDPYGQVDTGRLVVLGEMRTATLNYNVSEGEALPNGQFPTLVKESLTVPGFRTVAFSPDYALQAPGIHRVESGKEVFCLTMNLSLICLVLRCMDADEQSYERIGLCELRPADRSRQMHDSERRLTTIL